MGVSHVNKRVDNHNSKTLKTNETLQGYIYVLLNRFWNFLAHMSKIGTLLKIHLDMLCY